MSGCHGIFLIVLTTFSMEYISFNICNDRDDNDSLSKHKLIIFINDGILFFQSDSM